MSDFKDRTIHPKANVIELEPSQLVVRQYRDGNGYYVYAGLFDIIGYDAELYNRFVKASAERRLFNYYNTGTDGISPTHTFDDGNESSDWFIELCRVCKILTDNGVDVVFVLNKTKMTEVEVTKANATYTDTLSLSKSETEKIVDTYIWYFRQVLEQCGLKVKTLTTGKHVYDISIINNAFKIHIGKSIK